MYGGYNYSYRKSLTDLKLDREFYVNGSPVLNYDQLYYTIFPFNTHTANAGIDYDITKRTTIGVMLNTVNTSFDPDGTYNSKVLDGNKQQLSRFTTINRSKHRSRNYSANLNLRHIFDTLGTQLSTDIDYVLYAFGSTQNFVTNYYANDNSQLQAPYLLYGNIKTTTQIRSLKSDLTMPLRGGYNIAAGIKTSFVTADNHPSFYDRSTSGNLYDSTKSNHFIYNENVNAAYLSLSKEWEKWNLQLGLRTEQTNVKGEQLITAQTFTQQYIQVFPTAATQYKWNDANSFGFTLSRRIERPAYEQLNPYKQFLDPTEYDVGNPMLRPALTYSMEALHIYKEKFTTTLSYSRTDRVIVEVIKQDEANDKVTAQQNVNVGVMNLLMLNGSYAFNFIKRLHTMVIVDGYYFHYKGAFAGTNLDRGSAAYDFSINNTIDIGKGFNAECMFSYNGPVVYAFMDLQSMWNLDLGIQKKVNDRLKIKLNATDIFWRSNFRGTSYYNAYTQSFITRRDSRKITLSFTYDFGNKKNAIRKRAGGAEDEQRRIGGKGG